jgi:phosphoenolpyruvate carboxylase
MLILKSLPCDLSALPTTLKPSSASSRFIGRDLPLNAQLFKYSSWMGGDRDGNPNVTSLVTAHVVYLARWMAADLYLKEIDALHFEVQIQI